MTLTVHEYGVTRRYGEPDDAPEPEDLDPREAARLAAEAATRAFRERQKAERRAEVERQYRERREATPEPVTALPSRDNDPGPDYLTPKPESPASLNSIIESTDPEPQPTEDPPMASIVERWANRQAAAPEPEDDPGPEEIEDVEEDDEADEPELCRRGCGRPRHPGRCKGTPAPARRAEPRPDPPAPRVRRPEPVSDAEAEAEVEAAGDPLDDVWAILAVVIPMGPTRGRYALAEACRVLGI